MSVTVRTIPRTILVAAAVLAMTPVFSYLATAHVHGIGVGKVGLVLGLYGVEHFAFFILCWWTAVGLLRVTRWSFHALMVIALVLVVLHINFLVPLYAYMRPESPATAPAFVILCTLFFFLLVRREVSAPYLSLAPRAWRSEPRDGVPLPVEWSAGDKSGTGLTEGISASGCFIAAGEGAALPGPGEDVGVTVSLGDGEREGARVHVRGRVVRAREASKDEKAGVGIRFLYIADDWRIRQKLADFVALVFSPRYLVNNVISAEVVGEDRARRKIEGRLFNISSGGLYVESDDTVAVNERAQIVVERKYDQLRLDGIICWINPEGRFGKKRGFGVDIRRARDGFKFRLWLWRLGLYAPLVR